MLEKRCNNNFFLSLHDRAEIIHSKNNINNGKNTIEICAQPGEFYTFRLDVYTGSEEIKGLELEYSDLVSDGDHSIPASLFTCINIEKVDAYGKSSSEKTYIASESVQSFWISIKIPETKVQGLYTGHIAVKTENQGSRTATISLKVSGSILDDCGDGEPQRLSRLRWFNSSRGFDDMVTRPYIPVKAEDSTLYCLGRKISLNDMGLPEQITSMFSKSVDEILGQGTDILAQPFSFFIEEYGPNTGWQASSITYTHISQSEISWKAQAVNGSISLECLGSLEFDGYMTYKLILRSDSEVHLKDVSLEVPFRMDIARYAMGLGHNGGFTPEEIMWKWDSSVQQDSIWIGDVNAGLLVKFKGENYVKPFVNIYYKHRPLVLPEGWNNHGNGEIRLFSEGNSKKVLHASSGNLVMSTGSELHFNFDLLVTPLKPVDMKKHWNTRYFHRNEYNDGDQSKWIADAKRAGANVINIHHGNDLNPFINYPFIETAALKDFVSEAHRHGIKTKIYYTIREISDRMYEFPVIRSLGSEMLPQPEDGAVSFLWQGEAAKWVREHLGDDVIPAWKHTFTNGRYEGQIDAAILSDGTSRMANYYIEGLQWILANCNIDGIYVDDTDCDRNTMRRTRRVLDSFKNACLIDFHSWSHMNEHAGMVSSANLYMSLFPYIDSLWFGESFDYNSSPDYWLVEICGIPYGMTGEMLEGGGNPWRGMLFGMTNRLGWSGNSPEHIWKLWDHFGVQDSKMLGFWDERCPVCTDSKNVYATVYQRKEKIMVVLASWEDTEVDCSLNINWEAAGLSQGRNYAYCPNIPGLQEGHEDLDLKKPLHIEPGKGCILIIEG